jgi:nucleoside-diphosphate-sugar epimerase
LTAIASELQLEELLSTPNSRDVAMMNRLPGNIIIIGAGGKMGPSLARRVRRAADAAGVKRRVIAASRFSSPSSRDLLESAGVETIACDLLDEAQAPKLPLCENVLYLAGRKFGSTERADLTWAGNTVIPVNVARHYRASRIVVFSTGNVYPFVSAFSGGAVETTPPEPRGEYAQSCLGRERIFEFFSLEYGTPCLIFRLNYATDLRYGVLVDIARKVYSGQPVDLTMPSFNTIWQGDANSYALRSLELCASPPRILNVTGPETVSVRHAATVFAGLFERKAVFQNAEAELTLTSNATLCHQLLGYPEIALGELIAWVAQWIRQGGASLNKPTRFEVIDGRF